MPRVLRWSKEGTRCLMSEVPLQGSPSSGQGGNNRKGLKNYLKANARIWPGLDCVVCAIFARYRGISPIRKRLSLEPYSGAMPRVLRCFLGGGVRLLMSEVPL
jgi:hypothetical protein